MKKPRVAIVHDWMLLGGAEKVVEQLLAMYPDAPLYTSCISPEWSEKLSGRTVVTGYLNWPVFKKMRKFTPFLRQRWFESLNLSQFDIVISSSGAEAKGVRVPDGTIHINYCHAPTHYYWSRYEEYMINPGFGFFNPIARFGLKLLLRPMRRWDLKASKRPHIMIANSTHTAKEIQKYYGREAVVIYPPVETRAFLASKNAERGGYVIVGRQAPYKRFDLAVLACTQLGRNLTVIGTGPEHKKLQSLAGPTITFTGQLARDEFIQKLHAAKAFLFPGLDDFGIAPVEAMAAGCPVIAYKAGGALDYVESGVSGVFFDEQTVYSLMTAIKKFEKLNFHDSSVVKKAVSFNPERFKVEVGELVQRTYANFNRN